MNDNKPVFLMSKYSHYIDSTYLIGCIKSFCLSKVLV